MLGQTAPPPEDLESGVEVGRRDVDDLVEPAGPGEGGVERVGPVRGAHHDHVAVVQNRLRLKVKSETNFFTFLR